MSKFDWSVVQKFYDKGHSSRETANHFQMSTRTFTLAARSGKVITRSKSDASKNGASKRPPHSVETKEKLSIIARKRGFGGKNYRKTFYVNGICLESTYELALANELTENSIQWVRPGRFKWIDEVGVERTYTPDFYLPDYNVYLDPKNDYLIKIDIDKINRVCLQNNIKVLILNKNQLTWNYIAGLV